MTFPVHAGTLLLPGGLISPVEGLSVNSTPSFLEDLTGSFSIDSGSITGTFEEVVVVDPLGSTCSGCLDYAFQVTVDANSPDPLEEQKLPFARRGASG